MGSRDTETKTVSSGGRLPAGGSETSPLQNKRSRIVWIDIMRGFLMFWVIFGHITEVPDHYIYIYSFHMPAYFFLTGITFAFNRTRSTPGFIAKKFFELMVPYFILNLYVAPLREWLEYLGGIKSQGFSDLLLGILYSNGDSGYKMASNTLWFIPCLFVATVLFFLIKKACGNKALPIALVVAVLTTAAWVFDFDSGSGGPVHYKGAIFSVAFVMSGYFFSKYMGKITDLIHLHRNWAVFIALLALAAGYAISEENGYVSIIVNEYKSLILFYGSALLTILALTTLLILLTESKRVVKICRPLEFIGRKTLPYIAFQVPLMKLMWVFMADTFGTREMPWTLIQTVFLFFAMMPLAYWVDKLVPRVMPDCIEKLLRKLARKVGLVPARKTAGQTVK